MRETRVMMTKTKEMRIRGVNPHQISKRKAVEMEVDLLPLLCSEVRVKESPGQMMSQWELRRLLPTKHPQPQSNRAPIRDKRACLRRLREKSLLL
jgi:hypothetical protein